MTDPRVASAIAAAAASRIDTLLDNINRGADFSEVADRLADLACNVARLLAGCGLLTDQRRAHLTNVTVRLRRAHAGAPDLPAKTVFLAAAAEVVALTVDLVRTAADSAGHHSTSAFPERLSPDDTSTCVLNRLQEQMMDEAHGLDYAYVVVDFGQGTDIECLLCRLVSEDGEPFAILPLARPSGYPAKVALCRTRLVCIANASADQPAKYLHTTAVPLTGA